MIIIFINITVHMYGTKKKYRAIYIFTDDEKNEELFRSDLRKYRTVYRQAEMW